MLREIYIRWVPRILYTIFIKGKMPDEGIQILLIFCIHNGTVILYVEDCEELQIKNRKLYVLYFIFYIKLLYFDKMYHRVSKKSINA